MIMVESQKIFNIARDPQLVNTLDRNKNHPLFRKYSQKPFNI